MEQDFYKSRIEENNIKVIVPVEKNREKLNEIIYTELCLGKITSQSREYYKRVIEELVQKRSTGNNFRLYRNRIINKAGRRISSDI